MVEGSSGYKLLYHELVSEFTNKLLSLAQDIVLSLKQVLNLLDSPVPETFRYLFLVVFCLIGLFPASVSFTERCFLPT